MYWFSYIVMIIPWVMMVVLFVLVAAVLIELFKFLKHKNAAFDVMDVKARDDTSPKQDSL